MKTRGIFRLPFDSGTGQILRSVIIIIPILGVAMLLRLWPLQGIGLHVPYLTFYPAVMVSAMLGGLMSGLPATLLSAMTVYLWQSRTLPYLSDPVNRQSMLVFVISGLILSVISETLIRARSRKRISLHESFMKRRHEELIADANRKIEDSENRFRMLFEESPVGMIVANPDDWTILHANIKAVELFGFNREELRERDIISLTSKDDREETRKRGGQIPFRGY